MISAVAEEGYATATVAHVVARARVSRKAFYDHFSGLESCFLTALDAAQQVIAKELTGAPRDPSAADPSLAVLRGGLRAYLALCAREPEYARCIFIELPAAGPRAVRGRDRGHRMVADLLRRWRERAAARHPEWRPVPDECHLAAVGAVAELVTAHVARGETERLPALHGVMTGIVLRVLDAPIPD
ncbi:TetR/AcrR family transcriptional regulator [Actinomadura fibrosa]|uniref:TetR/AcrR family transcriptional regulator n=1 Tax=Actinomadura fibrosa TaxID=111802 RepID=A0ABW2XLE4_9ACTN|nr:TetR/AcrR family transcriptional regulator [Actinomadura fibrosa]